MITTMNNSELKFIEASELTEAEFNYLANIIHELIVEGLPEKEISSTDIDLDFNKPVISLNQLSEIMAAANIHHDGCNNIMGNKIAAIKRIREITNCGLKDAKDAIEGKRPCL
jgi:ribosomal protein L7/L12